MKPATKVKLLVNAMMGSVMLGTLAMVTVPQWSGNDTSEDPIRAKEVFSLVNSYGVQNFSEALEHINDRDFPDQVKYNACFRSSALSYKYSLDNAFMVLDKNDIDTVHLGAAEDFIAVAINNLQTQIKDCESTFPRQALLSSNYEAITKIFDGAVNNFTTRIQPLLCNGDEYVEKNAKDDCGAIEISFPKMQSPAA